MLRANKPDARPSKEHTPTIGVDFAVCLVNVIDPQTETHTRIKLQMWDTAGQERFRTLTHSYYNGAQVIWMVYDCSRPDTVDKLIHVWWPEVCVHAQIDLVSVIVIGNKMDLRGRNPDRDELVTSKVLKLLDVLQKARSRSVAHIEVSTLCDVSVVPVLELAARECIGRVETRSLVEENARLSLSAEPAHKSSCCHIL